MSYDVVVVFVSVKQMTCNFWGYLDFPVRVKYKLEESEPC